MSLMSLMHLKSGTDIRGTALGEQNEFTDEVIKALIYGFVCVLGKKTNLAPSEMKVSVGYDSRLSSKAINASVVEALLECGVDTLACCLSSTPAMFMTTVELGCCGAVMITASHLPSDKNGLKFFSREGGFEGEDIVEIIRLAEAFDALPYCQAGKLQNVDFMTSYAHMLRSMICKGVNSKNYDKPLEGFHIVVDAGNGVGGFYAKNVLAPLGADISGSQFLEPDGSFPNHIPNPEDEVAMSFICNAVTQASADLGVIFDTDVDRAACVTKDGKELNRNRLVALASVLALEGHEGGTIVTDSVTSDGLAQFINSQLGGVHHRFKRGYKNVINEALRLNSEGIDSPLAIETSGHAAFKENYFLDDGAYLITRIIIKAAQLRSQGKELSSLIASLNEPLETAAIRLKITEAIFKPYGLAAIELLQQQALKSACQSLATDSHEGVRISFNKQSGDGWALLRLSVHDPILPLNIESNSQGGVRTIARQLSATLEAAEGIDISPLLKLAE